MRLALAAVAAFTLFITGCAGDKAGTAADPTVEEAIDLTKLAGSARISIEALEGGNQIAGSCEGAVDYGHGRIQAECAFGAFHYELLGFGRTFYSRASADEAWRLSSTDRTESFLDAELGALFDVLRSAAVGRRLEDEEVRGESTVGWELTVDCARAERVCSGTTQLVEVRIDDEGLVRRITANDAGGPGIIELFDFGVEVDIQPPPHDEVDEPDEAGYPVSGSQTRLSPCPGGGTPISVQAATAALRRSGMSVGVREYTVRCREGVADRLHTHGGYRVAQREGGVTCTVYLAPPDDSWSEVVRTEGAVGGRAVDYELENLVCRMVGDGPDDPKVSNLERAFDELRRAIGP